HPGVSRLDRPTGGRVGGSSKPVGTVEDQRGVLVRRELLQEVVVVEGAQELRPWDDPVLLPELGVVRVEDRRRWAGLLQRFELGKLDEAELLLRFRSEGEPPDEEESQGEESEAIHCLRS